MIFHTCLKHSFKRLLDQILHIYWLPLVFFSPCRICDGVQFGAGIRFLWLHICRICASLFFIFNCTLETFSGRKKMGLQNCVWKCIDSIKVFALIFLFYMYILLPCAVSGHTQCLWSNLNQQGGSDRSTKSCTELSAKTGIRVAAADDQAPTEVWYSYNVTCILESTRSSYKLCNSKNEYAVINIQKI